MKTVCNFKKMIASTALLAAAMGVSLSAEAGLFSRATISLANEVQNLGYFLVADGTPAYSSSGGLTDTGDYFREFSGIDSNGDSATTSFSARAYSQSAYGILKTYATGTLSNPISPSAGNDPFVVDENFSVNPNGMPEYYSAEADAMFSDILTISSSVNVSSIQLQLSISGGLDSEGVDSFDSAFTCSGIYQANSTSLIALSSTIWDGCYRDDAQINKTIWSNPIPVIGNQAAFQLQLNSLISFYTYFLFEGNTYSLISDFSHTLNVASIVGYDANGQQVNLTSAIGASGTRYTVAAPINPGTSIPEPASLALLGIGLVGMGWARRRG